MFLNYFRRKTEFIFENKIKNPKKIFQYKYICHSIFFKLNSIKKMKIFILSYKYEILTVK